MDWLDADEHIYTDDEPVDYCPICGAEMEWEECHAVGCEDGWYDGYEFDDPLWFSPGEMVRCEECGGKGGYWVCINSPHAEAQP